jgi:apocytochrome f
LHNKIIQIPRAANGKLACANCHLNQKAIEIEAPQAVLPNSVFEVEIKVPYDVTKTTNWCKWKKS